MGSLKKRHITSIAVAMAVFGFAAISWGLPNGVKYTSHNLGATGKGNFAGGTETEICVYCHTPHNSVAGQKFLWNRIGQTSSFALYTASPTLNFTKSVTISDVSKMCMSCHDGATAMNSMANPRPGTVSQRLGDVWDPAELAGEWGPNIGEWGVTSGGTGGNLTNDHPISFNYNESQAAEASAGTLYEISVPQGRGLVFWGPNGNMVECVTCHDPHVNYGSWYSRDPLRQHSLGTFDRSLAPFLRRSNASSGLCFSCHNK